MLTPLSCLLALVLASIVHAQPYTWQVIAGGPGAPKTVDGTNTTARFSYPKGITVNSHGHLFVTEQHGNVVRELTPIGTNWVVTTIATNLNQPAGITVDSDDNLLVANYGSHQIIKLVTTGTNWLMSTIASLESGALPDGIAVRPDGLIFATDHWNRILLGIAPEGTNWTVSTLAGSPQGLASLDGTNTDARFGIAAGIRLASSGLLYVADNWGNVIRQVEQQQETNWVVTTLAGTPAQCGGVDATNSDALFCAPTDIAVDSTGSLFAADAGNKAIRKMTHIGSDWVVTSVGPAYGAMNYIWGIAMSPAGDLYVCDYFGQTVWQGKQLIPALAIAISGDTVTLSWPMAVANFVLESNSAAEKKNAWTPVAGMFSTNGPSLVRQVKADTTQTLYRLRKQ